MAAEQKMDFKNIYPELQAFLKNTHSNKEEYHLFKKDLDHIHSLLRKGGDVVHPSKSLIEKHPELERIYNGSGHHGDPGFIIILIIIIILISTADAY